MDQDIKKNLTKNWFKILQEIICKDIEEIENRKDIFEISNWTRGKANNEGGGQFRIFEKGKVFDKVGVNFSEVFGKFSKNVKNKIPGTSKSLKFWASGVSVVMHMKNPHVPAMHFNTRYIVTDHGWFGGGMDITPCLKDEKLKMVSSGIKSPAMYIIKNIIQNIKNGVTITFICLIEMNPEV